MYKKMFCLCCLCAFGLFMGSAAKADTIYNLTVDGCSSGCDLPASGSYGTIDLSQSGSNVDVTETLASGYYFVNTGAGEALEFNASGTIADISPSSAFGTGLAPTKNGSYFGTFTESVACLHSASGCGHGSEYSQKNDLNMLSFTVADVTLADFQNESSNGYLFASDVIDSGTGGTGEVGAGPEMTTVIPEPSSLLLLGSGILALAIFLRRKRWSM
jgi:hypothetical protein